MTTREKRYDRAGSLKTTQKRANGFMFAEGRVAKPGVLKYLRKDGTVRRELVTEEVLNESTFAGVPVTKGHPPGSVRADNAKDHSVGSTAHRVKREEGGYVVLEMAIHDGEAQEEVEEGRKDELSPGYWVELEEEEGVHPEYGRYDAIQKSRTVNHVALVEKARAGSDVRVRTDSSDEPVAVQLSEEKCLTRLDEALGVSEAPVADPDTEWSSGDEVQQLQEELDFDPSGDEEVPSEYRDAFLVREGDESDVSSYKLPYKGVIDGEIKIVPAAAAAINSVMSGGRGGVDLPNTSREKVMESLDRLYSIIHNEFSEWPESPEKENEDSMGSKNEDNSQTKESKDSMDISQIEELISTLDDYRGDESAVKVPKGLEETMDEVAEALDEAAEAMDEREEQIEELRGKVDALEASTEEQPKEGDGEQRGDEVSDAFLDSREDALEWYSERADAEEVAEKFDVENLDAKSTIELKREVVDQRMDAEGESDSYVRAAFDMITEKMEKADESYGRASEILEENSRSDGEEARSAYRERLGLS